MVGRRRLGTVLLGVGAVLIVIGIAGLVWPSGDDEAETTTSATTEPAPPQVPAEASEPSEDEVTAFVIELFGAIRDGDDVTLYAGLDDRVTELYGGAQCRRHVSGFRDASLSVEVLRVASPAPWDWEVDGTSTTIPDAIEVAIRRSTQGETDKVDIHIGSDNGLLSWFTDCGEPRG